VALYVISPLHLHGAVLNKTQGQLTFLSHDGGHYYRYVNYMKIKIKLSSICIDVFND
jgi:hypothetical protein